MSRCSLLCLALSLVIPASLAAQELPAGLTDAIRQEATRPNRGEVGQPLPLAAHWNVTGIYMQGFTPAYQLQLLRKGHHILPWLEYPPTDWNLERIFKHDDPRKRKYIDARLQEFERSVKELARHGLPISFLATQWESILTYDKEFFGPPADKNPNVIGADGKVLAQVCPFGPIEPWRKVGKIWTYNMFLKRIAEWYPDPPLILFISNNEHAWQQWSDVEQSKR